MLKLDLKYNKNILFVKLDGNLNRTSSYKINHYLVPTILNNNIKYLVFNLGELINIDEDGVDALLNVKYAIKNNKGLVFINDINKIVNKKINKLHIKKLNDKKIGA